MYNTLSEQVIAANKTAVEAMLAIANATFSGVERLAALNLNAARSAMEDGVANAKTLLAVRDVDGIVGLQNTLTKPSLDKVTAYSRSIYEIASQTKEDLSKIVEAQVAEINKAVATTIDSATKNAPAGSDVAVSAVKSAIAAANSAFESINKAAKQATEIAEANVAAATSATIKAVGNVATVTPVASKAKKAA